MILLEQKKNRERECVCVYPVKCYVRVKTCSLGCAINNK